MTSQNVLKAAGPIAGEGIRLNVEARKGAISSSELGVN